MGVLGWPCHYLAEVLSTRRAQVRVCCSQIVSEHHEPPLLRHASLPQYQAPTWSILLATTPVHTKRAHA